MADYVIKDTTLTGIADAIRSKTGKSEQILTENMESEIMSITSGGGDLPPEAFVISGGCQYRFANDGWNWFLENYGDRVTTQGIMDAQYMFYNCGGLEEILFEINMAKNCGEFSSMFYDCNNLKTCPKINLSVNQYIKYNNLAFVHLFRSCKDIRNTDNLFNSEDLNFLSSIKVTNQYASINFSYVFYGCCSLRTVPNWWYKFKFNEESTFYPTYNFCLYNNAFYGCSSLNEVVNIPVLRCNGNQTTNMFSGTFNQCCRLKNMTFETNGGQPYVVSWKSQVIDLTDTLGYAGGYAWNIISHNSGITKDKEIKDAETYNLLKNDPDWYTTNTQYSRYNHDSAVATINSLPDTSAYLATAGGTNTIKFKGQSGELTDGGAINTLTEEEIAVATAKGWTVTFV